MLRRSRLELKITQGEQRRRAHIVSLARRDLEIEGWRSSDATWALQNAYIEGEADLDELVAQAQAEPAGF